MGIGHVDVELAKRADGSRRQAVAADLVPAVGSLLEHDDLRTEAGGADRGGCAGGSASDDCDVDLVHRSTVPGKAPICTVVPAKPRAAPVTSDPYRTFRLPIPTADHRGVSWNPSTPRIIRINKEQSS